jgi:hypothetical protein
MRLTSKTRASKAEKIERPKNSGPDLKVLTNPNFGPYPAPPGDICEYIGTMASELGRTAANANQEVLAYFLGMAAQEALAQAGRVAIAR